MDRPKEPLYRKHNKLARGFFHSDPGGQFRYERNSKAMKNFEGTHKPVGKTQEGFDYTPLFRFLLSKVGTKWDEVFSEASGRLDKEAPIFWMVKMDFKEGDRETVCIGGRSFYSILTVKDGILVRADPNATGPQKFCNCCTHTFNGKPY